MAGPLAAAANPTVNIYINAQTGQAARQLNQLGAAGQRAATGVARANRAMVSMSSVIATMIKALVSMIAVIIVFNLAITLPERAFQLLAVGIQAAFEALVNFEQRVIGMQAVLASLMTFSKIPIENFRIAGEIATQVMEDLLKRSKETLTTIEETALVFQTLLNNNVQAFVNNMQEAEDLAILLANAISVVTVGQDRQRQMVQETRDLMRGTIRANSLLALLAFGSAEEFKRVRDSIKDSKEFLAVMQERLIGFVQATEKYATTWEGLKSSFQDLLTRFSRIAFTPIFTRIKKELLEIYDVLDKDEKLMWRMSAAIGAAFDVLSNVLLKTLGISGLQIEDVFDRIIALMPRVVYWIVKIYTHLLNFYELLKVIWPLILFSFSKSIAIVVLFADAIATAMANAAKTISYFATAMEEFSKGNLTAGFRALAQAFGEGAKLVWTSFRDTLKTAWEQLGDIIRGTVNWKTTIQDADAAGAAAANAWMASYAEKLTEIPATKIDLSKVMLLGKMPPDIEGFMARMNLQLRTGRIGLRQFAEALRAFRLGVEGFSDENFNRSLGRLAQKYYELRDSVGEYQKKLKEIRMMKLAAEPFFGEESEEMLGLERLQEEYELLLQQMRDDSAEYARAILSIWDMTWRDMGKIMWNSGFLQLWDKTLLMLNRDASMSFGDLKKLFTDLITWIKENPVLALKMIGDAMADVFEQAIIAGKGFKQAFKDFLAELLVALGKWAIAMGTIWLIGGLIFQDYKTAALGAALIAAGAAALALAALLKGGGGAAAEGAEAGAGEARPAATYISQRDIAAQQGVQVVMRENTEAIRGLNMQLDRLSRERGEVLVERTVRDNPSIVMKPLTSNAGLSYQAARSIGGAILGQP